MNTRFFIFAGLVPAFCFTRVVEGIIFDCACGAGDEICAAEIGGRKRVVLQLCNDSPAVQQVAREDALRQLRRADAGGVVEFPGRQRRPGK